MKKSNKIPKKSEKNAGCCFGNAVFRVQCAFPNIELEAVLNEKSIKIPKKSEKNRGC